MTQACRCSCACEFNRITVFRTSADIRTIFPDSASAMARLPLTALAVVRSILLTVMLNRVYARLLG